MRYEERVQISLTQSIWQPVNGRDIEETRDGDLRYQTFVGMDGAGKPVEAVRTLPRQLWRKL